MSKDFSTQFASKKEEIIWLKQQLLSEQQTPNIAMCQIGNSMLFAYLVLLSFPVFCFWYLFFVFPNPWLEQFDNDWITDFGLLILSCICTKYAVINIYSHIYPPLIITRYGLQIRGKIGVICWQEIDYVTIRPCFSVLNFIFPLWEFNSIIIEYLAIDFINDPKPTAQRKNLKLLVNKCSLDEKMIIETLTKYRNNAFARYRLAQLDET